LSVLFVVSKISRKHCRNEAHVAKFMTAFLQRLPFSAHRSLMAVCDQLYGTMAPFL
jgi:hypothetical protein